MWCIENSGEIEIGALTLLGASTKGAGSSKIGFFGSGAKYGLATLLRNGINVRIFSGTREIAVETRRVDFDGERFDQIWLDGQPTSFTTRMGPSWETWFAVREFVCNAIDEGGAVWYEETEYAINGEAGVTRVFIEATPGVIDFFESHEKYMTEAEPLDIVGDPGSSVSILEAMSDSEFIVYRKGIRVSPFSSSRKSVFRYNYDDIEINESRIFVYNYEVRDNAAYALATTENVDIIRTLIGHLDECTDPNLFENELAWRGLEMSKAWLEVIGKREVIHKSIASYLPPEDIAAGIVLEDSLVEALANSFPEMNIRNAKARLYRGVEIDDDIYQQIKKACHEVEEMGIEVPTWKVVDFFTSDTTAALYVDDERTMLLSHKHLADYDELVATVVEESLHMKGFKDGSRAFEQDLMRRLVSMNREARLSRKIKEVIEG